MVARDGVLARALWIGDEQVLLRAWAAGKAVRIHAESESPEAAAAAIERMRFALGTDHDLSEFQRRFPLGPADRPRDPAPSRGCGRAARSRSRRSPGRSASS